ncbi:MAG: rRNA pseudouridine synthase [Alphaproteobacteria bacterium]|nr:MAG: rRNA pseudouridine synthase [Alphaproteobacteria bacterium]
MRAGQEKSPAHERIAKVIARAGLCSRREAEAWIAAGRVAVNGEIVASPARNVTTADRIAVDGRELPQRERTRLFLYHKPRGLLTAHADPGGRPTIFSALPKGLPRLISVGRLDINTEGLLLLTNDGSLARVLELPATGWLRRYRVRAYGRATQEQLEGLRPGITIDGIRYGPIEARLERAQGSNVWLEARETPPGPGAVRAPRARDEGKRKHRRADSERRGGPELARREKRRGWRGRGARGERR